MTDQPAIPPVPFTALQIERPVPRLLDATMLLAFSGWMDGGNVSTGTVRRLLEDGQAEKIAEIAPEPFYVYNFPGSMEIAALFRPHVKYVGGMIERLDMPANEFFVDVPRNMVFFVGKEPNMAWETFGDCIFDVAEQAGVQRIIFIGSFGGAVPHTREPRLYASVSDAKLKPWLEEVGMRFSDYEGPASFASYLTARSPRHGMQMISLAAEIPGYLQGVNPLSIEAVTRRLAKMLDLPVKLEAMRKASNDWESEVSEAVEKDEDLAATVRKLEVEYDDDLIGGSSTENT